MTASPSSDPIAFRVADKLRATVPWEVYGQRARRYELHFNGRVVEFLRGPLLVEGFGVRVFRPREDKTGTGFQASTDSSDRGIADALSSAETIASHATFPTKKVELPGAAPSGPGPEIVDPKLWESPLARIEAYAAALLAPFDGLKEAAPSFGSLRATLSENSIANSSGLRSHYSDTSVDLELAVKSFGGPEGAPPGEYWVNSVDRRADPSHAGDQVPLWVQYARDTRLAKSPPSGELPVVLPAEATATILPGVLGFRFSGAARLREMSFASGTVVGAPSVTVRDEGRFPWGANSAPYDDEGTTTGSHTLIRSGAARDLLYDVLHAGAFGEAPSGNGQRGLSFGRRDWMRFSHGAGIGPSTIVLEPGTGGRDEEIIEAAGDGIWVQQLGWASPDPLSGSFGGEIRIGYRIRNGKLAEPVRGGIVGGLVIGPAGTPSLLANVVALGSTATLNENFSGPTMLVRPLTVAGA